MTVIPNTNMAFVAAPPAPLLLVVPTARPPRLPRLVPCRPEGGGCRPRKSRQFQGAFLLGITVVFGNASRVAAAAARDALPSPGPGLAPAGCATRIRGAVAAAG